MSVRRIATVVLPIITCALTVFGETIISGDLSKVEFIPANNPFMVNADVEIPVNTVTVIDAGCVLLFSPFAGMNVSGTLLVKGLPENPVVFTSIKDTSVNGGRDSLAGLFDWNGVYIKPDADSIRMSNFELRYSVYGIKTQTKNIVLKNGTFKANGQLHFSINDKLQLVQDNIPFSYPSVETADTTSVSRSDSIMISSSPSTAEVYFNKKPGKRIRRDGLTPVLLPRTVGPNVAITLFKKAFNDTTLVIGLSKLSGNLSIALTPLSAEKAPAQAFFLRERLHVRIGLGCLVAVPVFIGGGAATAYAAHQERGDADDAADFLNNTILPRTDPEYLRRKNIFDDATGRADFRRNGAIALFGIGIAALSAGVILYW